MKENQKDKKMKLDDVLTNTPNKEEFTIRTDVNPKDLFHTTAYYAGDAVNEHKELEEANQIVGEEEIKQQNENL